MIIIVGIHLYAHVEQNQHTQNYGTTKTIIAKGESMARKRVVSFLTVFIITGFFSELALELISA